MATLATLIVKLTGDAADFFNEMDKVEKSSSSILGSIGSNVQSLGNVALAGLGVVAGAATAAGAGLAKLAIDAAPIEGISKSFEGLAESAGYGADEMLAALEKGSTGMIAQTDLMTSFNKAAQLVSTDFAVQLPDAMQYLGKVSAATGQDMGFMLDSLVTGVGRLSPMILDNLGIQVQLSEATAMAAEMFGVEEDALSKTQTQAGMMSVVLEKLQANTAAMPDVAGSAAAGLAQMEAKFKNLKDQAGMALLPVLNTLLGTFGNLTDAVLPPLIGFFETSLVPALEKGAQFVDSFVSSIMAGQSPVEALQSALQSIGLNEIAEAVGTVADKVSELWATVQPYVAQAAAWIGQNVELQDVLIALGIAIGSVVIPAVISLLASIAPVIATAVAMVAVVALVREAWESNFLGIQDAAKTLQSKIQELWSKAQSFWDSFWGAFQPSLQRMYDRLQEFWTDIQPKLMEAWNTLQELWAEVEQLWTRTLKPALDRLTQSLGLGSAETSSFGEIVGTLAGLLLEIQLEGLINLITGAVTALTTAVNAIKSAMEAWKSIINSVKSALDGLDVPSWLKPGSPTPLELGIRGINEALQELNVTGSLSFGGKGGGGAMILAPIFLDPREYRLAGGEIDYAALGRRLTQLQEAI
jgi:hypothetical protein